MTKSTKVTNQLEAGLTEENELVLIESRTMRDQHVYRDNVIEKVKAISLLGDRFEATLQMASDYYEVPIETVRAIIKRHRIEFNEYEELRLLKGKVLAEFKGLVHDAPDIISAPSLQLLNRRGLLRLGMLLTESEVAKSIRNYLLNVEKVSDIEQRRWAVEREIGKRERRQLTDAIQEFYLGTTMKGYEYAKITNLVYETIFDVSAKNLRELYELGKNEPLRDSFPTEDLRRIVKVEQTISVLLTLGKEYGEIKQELLSSRSKFL